MKRVLALIAMTAALAGCQSGFLTPNAPSNTRPGAYTPISSAPLPPVTTGPSAAAPAPIFTPFTPRMDSADQALLEADRALAVAVQDRGLGSGIADVAELDAMVLTPSGAFVGIEQIRVGLKPAGNAGQLFWVPEKASMGSSGDYGSTTGRYVQVLRGAEAVQGRYVTVWRKDSSRTWKVVSTTALPVRIAPPPPPPKPVTPPRRTVRR